MSHFYRRYMKGQCELVFRELVNEGDNLNHPTIFHEAEAVATELVERSFKNLQLLKKRLLDLGYLYQNPTDVLVEAAPSCLEAIRSLEATKGILPLIIRKWYERIGSVDFTQDDSQLFCKDRSQQLTVTGLGIHTPLVFLEIPKCLMIQNQLSINAKIDGEDPNRFDHFFPLGAWASNSDLKGFWLPNKSFDGEYYNDGGGGIYFVEELRRAFKWGGFPYWENFIVRKSRVSGLQFLPEFEFILPILTDGLLLV